MVSIAKIAKINSRVRSERSRVDNVCGNSPRERLNSAGGNNERCSTDRQRRRRRGSRRFTRRRRRRRRRRPLVEASARAAKPARRQNQLASRAFRSVFYKYCRQPKSAVNTGVAVKSRIPADTFTVTAAERSETRVSRALKTNDSARFWNAAKLGGIIVSNKCL